MATSRETIDHVRNILKKLDRSIDDARRKRLADDEPAGSVRPANSEADRNDSRAYNHEEELPLRAKPMAKRRDPLGPWSPGPREN